MTRSTIPLVSTAAKGRDFVRVAIARAVGNEDTAAARWGSCSRPAVAIKAAVSPITDTDVHSTAREVAVEFLEAVRRVSIVGRLAGLVEVPFNVRVLTITGGAQGYWVAESKPAPLSKMAMVGSSLPSRKVRAIVVATNESLGGGLTEGRVHADLQRACAEAIDLAFIDPSNAGVADERPASVTHGAASAASSGDASADVQALVEGFQGDLSAAHFVTDPLTAAQMALWRGAEGGYAFPDLGPRGGFIMGIPAVVSRSSPRDSSGGQLALVDPTGIAIAIDDVDVSIAKHATLLMSDDPEGDDPEEIEQVSMFQYNNVAFSVVVRANWEVQRPGSVAVVTAASY
jgi:HK97 family phage major capsid protein